MTFIFRLAGKARRTPHEYHAIDHLTYKPKQRLLNTHECVHASVRIRMGLRGYGYNDQGFYDSQGLAGWTMEGTESPTPTTTIGITDRRGSQLASMVDVKWVKKDPQERNDPEMVMPEDELGELEREVMKSWPDVERGFAMIRPGTHSLRMNKSSTDPPEPSPRFLEGQAPEKSQVITVGKVIKSPTLMTL
jgi:hypothetical protein